MVMKSGLRELSEQIYAVTKAHKCCSQAMPAVATLLDHLSAIARCEEANQQIFELEQKGKTRD
jgi:hypothetical protein